MASANSSSLRPAWRNSSGGRGFQPPPSVGASSDPPPQSQHQQRGGRSQSSGSLSDNADNNTNTRASGTYNKFSALDDDEDGLESSSGAQPPSSHHHHHHHHHPQSTRAGNSRSEALRHGLGSRGSGGGGTIMGGGPSKPGGRSLADLAAQAPGRFGTSSSSSRSATAAAGEEGKVIRFTREKLLSMRPVPINELPEVLQAYEGNAILSEEPLDPVCWDNFNAEEIWATVPVRRAGKPVTGGRSLSEMAEGSGGVGGPPRGPRRESASNAGRWQRGVALPPPSATDGGGSKGRKDRDSSSNVENPDDLWDDPVSGSAAGDFSAFGDLGGGGKGDGFDDTHGDDTAIFDFEKMTQASQLLEDELHGTSSNRSRASSEGSSNAGLESNHNHQRNGGTTIPAAPPVVVSKAIDGKRPLATTGTTIRSGSGDDVNVFEDFDEPLSSDSTPTAVDPIPVGSTHQDDSSKKSQDEASAVEKDDLGGDVVELNKQNPDHSGSSKTDTDIDATSRLMAMIGVSSALPATEKEPNTETDPSIEAQAEKPSVVESMAVDPSQPPKPSMSSPWGDIIHGSPPTTGDQPLDGLSIPLNPWGGGSLLGPSASDLIRPQGGPSLLQQPDAAVPNEPPIKGLDLQARLREADLEQKAREQQEELARQQQRRRQEELEAQKRAAEMQQQQQQQQQQAAARQQQQRQEQQQGVVSQVELVLMERISIILENSWGRSDLMSILATLHAEDTRVIPLLNTMEALRALIARNPSRVALRHDPAFGAEMAVLLVTNTQWQQQQQQRQQQQQEALNRRRQEEEIRRREQQQRLMEEEQAASEALRKQQQQQQEAKFVIVPGAPWYYSDPQQNIQGPFRGEEMRQWYDAGYFKGDLPVSQDSGGPFRLLSDIYPNLDLAFTTHGTQQQQQQPQNQRNQQREEAAVAAAAEEEARRRAKGIDRETADLARSREMAEAEERERLDREAAAEKEKKAREAAMAERRVRPQQQSTGHNATRADDSHDTSDGGNESSAQLKMMLGLAAQQQQKQLQKQEQQPLHSNAPKPRDVPPAPKRASNKGANKKASASKVAHQAAGGAPAPTIHDLSLQQQQNVSQAPKPAASAWGVASNPQPTSRKSMSEIQQEEARMAALQTQRERSGISAPSSGWANVAASKGSSSGPTGSWSGSATAKLAPTMVLANKEMGMPKPTQVLRKQSAPSATTRAQVSNVAAINAASAKQQHGAQQPAAATSGDEFGAKMSPALEKWCKEQMVKLNGTDDLTLVSFCMTLNDPNEIRQYLVTYLGSSPQVNNFANEFIHHKVGVKPVKAEEWETTVSSKKKGKKKTTTAGGR